MEKILVLQLARLGDIYQTWPVLRAIKREAQVKSGAGAELHLLTRSKFAVAAPAGNVIDRHWTMDSREILSPLIDEKPKIDQSLNLLSEFVDELRSQGFTKIINLTFSAFSSYLVSEISQEQTEVRGYTRFSDGYLAIPDDGSAYFYAQVGPGRANRLHLTDLLAHVAGVELTETDWSFAPVKPVAPTLGVQAGSIVVHVGASDLGKTLNASKWGLVVKNLRSTGSEQIVLVGSKEEQAIAEQVAGSSESPRVLNLVGKTSLEELFSIVVGAKLVIGGDSGPMQIATLVNTPVLNLSFPMVCFWETGPRSAGSRILRIESEDAISAQEIVSEARAMLNGAPATTSNAIRVLGRTSPYLEARPVAGMFEWELLRALYLGEAFPPPSSELFLAALGRLSEVNMLALEQIDALQKNHNDEVASSILDRVDEIVAQIAKFAPETGVVVRWFQTERTRIGPMPLSDLFVATRAVHRRLNEVLSLYVTTGEAAVTSNDAQVGA